MIRDIMTYKIITGDIDDSFKNISLLMKENNMFKNNDKSLFLLRKNFIKD